jgi:hypothetical protein
MKAVKGFLDMLIYGPNDVYPRVTSGASLAARVYEAELVLTCNGDVPAWSPYVIAESIKPHHYCTTTNPN